MSEKSYLQITVEALKDARRDNIAEIAYEQAGDQPDIGIIHACRSELREINGLLIVLEDYAMKLAGAAPNNAQRDTCQHNSGFGESTGRNATDWPRDANGAPIADPTWPSPGYPADVGSAIGGVGAAQRLNDTAKQATANDINAAGQAASPQPPTDTPAAEEARFIRDVHAAGGEYLGNRQAAFKSVGEALAFGFQQAANNSKDYAVTGRL